MPRRRGFSSSRGSKYSASKSSDQKEPSEIVRNTALVRGMSTIEEFFQSLTIHSECKIYRRVYEECKEMHGPCLYCDSFLEELSKCPDFKKDV